MSPTETRPILLCYDGSPGAARAIEKAGALFPGQTAIVLHVWSPIALVLSRYGGMASPAVFDDEEIRGAASLIADAGATAATAAGLIATGDVAETSYEGTAHEILAAADRHDAALIVLGARGLSAFKSLLLGSVSHSVAQHAHRPVLIVPPATVAEVRSDVARRAHATA